MERVREIRPETVRTPMTQEVPVVPTTPATSPEPTSGRSRTRRRIRHRTRHVDRRSTRRTHRSTGGVVAAAAGALVLTTLGACGPAEPPPTPLPSPPAVATDLTGSGLTRADVDAWLDGTIPSALESGRIAGASVAVVHDGELLTARGFGEADVSTGTAVDPARTLFRVGSVSKTVTATAVMQLVDRGEVDLDTDVDHYTGLDLPHDHPVTLRHLLSHTPGYEERAAGLFLPPGQAVDLRRSLAQDPPAQVYEPGTTPAYSNYGMALAGYVVEAVSGMPFEDYVGQNILTPLGMTSSSFAQPLPDHLAQEVSQGYPTSDEATIDFEVVGVPPAGSMSATATDMARFMLAHLGHPVGGSAGTGGDTAILSDEALQLMREPALDAASLGALASGPRMGLGWFDESRNGRAVVGHGGDTLAFHSHLQLWPDDDTGVFLSVNSTGADAAALALREDLLDGFADRYFPADDATPVAVDPAARADHARALAGTYESTRGFHTTFLTLVGPLQPIRATVVDGDRVRFSPGVGIRSTVYEEVEPWVYQEVDGHRVLAVRTDDDGGVQLIGHDSAMSLTPVTPARAVALPGLVGGGVVLLLTVLAWPAGALVRLVRARRVRVRRDVRPADGAPVGPARVPRLVTRLAALAAVSGSATWAYVLVAALGMDPVPTAVIRTAQTLTALGVLGLPFSVWWTIAVFRVRSGRLRLAAAVMVVLGFAAFTFGAVELLLLSPDISY
ncbi:serine hydrolase [Dietzia natronolimnaea]|uniref:Serine hydrolase n=2 Tax=Dietzia natronolimnaea TaxID=161920 RepID=A0A2A2WLM1_9ACTN|nr:serine hydrolase [Dietzia natronolimnaea]